MQFGVLSAGLIISGKQYLLFASFDEALGIGRGVVPLQLTPRVFQVLLVALHTHARGVDNRAHTCMPLINIVKGCHEVQASQVQNGKQKQMFLLVA